MTETGIVLQILVFGWSEGEDSVNRIIEKENQFLFLRTNLIRLLPFPKDFFKKVLQSNLEIFKNFCWEF